MEQESRALLLKITLDVVCLLIVGFPILIFYVAGKPYERGFFCDDVSLRHPYKDSTVPNWSLYIVGLGLPIIAIAATEYLQARHSHSPPPPPLTVLQRKINIAGWMREVYKHVGVFGFGAAVSQLTTDIGKYTIGRLRPHFFDVCDPNVDCNDPRNNNVYITWFVCRKSNEKLIKDMRLSFPSGHSSFSMYCMLFLAMYLQSRLTWGGSKLLKHVLQFLALTLAVATALSRISDYKHHWSDVLSGVVLGVTVALVTVVFVSDLFPSPQPPQGFVAASPADPVPAEADRRDSDIEKPTNGSRQQNSVI